MAVRSARSDFSANRRSSFYGSRITGWWRSWDAAGSPRGEYLAVWAKRVCIAGLAVYAVLSVTDFVQTYSLIETTGGQVYEANPVAAGWLHNYGWSGLAIFKAGAVAVVAGVIAILARRRPKAGAGVVVAACLSLVYVTLYSHGLVTAKELDHPPTYDD